MGDWGTSRIAVAAASGALGLLALCAPARAQVGLPEDPVSGTTGTVEQTVTTTVDTVEDTVDTVEETAPTAPVSGTETTVVDTVDQTVNTVADTVDETVGTVEDTVGGVLDEGSPTSSTIPTGGGLDLPALPDLTTDAPDLVGGLLDGDDAGSAPAPDAASSIADANDMLGAPGVTPAGAADGSGDAPAASGDGPALDGGGEATAALERAARPPRPFILAARDVRTFGLPLVVALLLGAYLGFERWLGSRDPRVLTVPVHDELRSFR